MEETKITIFGTTHPKNCNCYFCTTWKNLGKKYEKPSNSTNKE